LQDNHFLKFNLLYFFSNRKKLYIYLTAGLILILFYGAILFILHSSFSFIPRPFHVVTFSIDKYYRCVYWFLIPFILISALAGEVHRIPVNIRIRINNYWQLLCFYFMQMSLVALWGTLLVGIITFVCFPIASKAVTLNDLLNIFWLLIFCYLNLTNIGLLLIYFARKFSEPISFLIVFTIALCDQYLLGHIIFRSTKLLYIPVISFTGITSALIENILLMISLLILLSIQNHKKEG